MITGPKLYHARRSQIETADLLEYHSNTLLGWLIRKKTGQYSNHTGMALRYSLIPGSDERVTTVESLGDGCALKFLSKRLCGFRGSVWLVKLNPEHDHRRAEIAESYLHYVGVGYDYKSLLLQLRRPVKLDRKRLFCSEGVHAALIDSGILPENFNDGIAIVPWEFQKTGLFMEPIRIW